MRDDVLDGIVRECSIGYQIRELTLEKDSDAEGPTYRATRWTLLEGSLVAVPADPTVGVGRDIAGYGSPVPVIVRAIRAMDGTGDGLDEDIGNAVRQACEDCIAACQSCATTCDACAAVCDRCRTASEACAAACRACIASCEAFLAGTATMADCIAACQACLAACATCGSTCAACPNGFAECAACVGSCGDCQTACNTCLSACAAVVSDAMSENEDEPSEGGRTLDHVEVRHSHNAPQGRTVIVSGQQPAPNGGTNSSELVAIAREYQATDLLPEWIEKGYTEAQALRAVAGRRAVPAPITPADAPLSDKEQREYSIVRAMNAIIEGKRDGLEFEVSDHVAKRLGKAASERSLFVPMTLYGQRPDAAPDTRTQLSVGAAGKGAETKFTEFGGFIDLLRNRLVTAQMGAQYLSGLQGDVGFTAQTAAGSFTWGTETANAALSSLSTALRTMSPKVGQSATTFTRQLLRQSVIDVENLVRNDIAKVHALGIDYAALHGSGAASEPRGVSNVVGIGSVVGGANGAQPTYDNVVDLQKELAVDNALDGSLGYVAHPLIGARLMKTQKFTTTNGDPVWTGSLLDGQVAGFKAMTSAQILSGQTKGTSTDCSPILFGDWEALLIGEWGAMELIIDPYTVGPAIIKVASIQMIDVFVRYAEKFAVMADARI